MSGEKQYRRPRAGSHRTRGCERRAGRVPGSRCTGYDPEGGGGPNSDCTPFRLYHKTGRGARRQNSELPRGMRLKSARRGRVDGLEPPSIRAVRNTPAKNGLRTQARKTRASTQQPENSRASREKSSVRCSIPPASEAANFHAALNFSPKSILNYRGSWQQIPLGSRGNWR